jgi:hypothetical protein
MRLPLKVFPNYYWMVQKLRKIEALPAMHSALSTQHFHEVNLHVMDRPNLWGMNAPLLSGAFILTANITTDSE